MTAEKKPTDEDRRAERARMKATALEQLRRANPRAPEQKVRLYVDAWVDYSVAQDNIDQLGAIVLHPQTGVPIENPFLTIRAQARKVLEQRTKLDVAILWNPPN